MARFENGQIPREWLVKVGEGVDEFGKYEHLLSPATAQKHFALIERSPGKALRASPGYSCYRPLYWQYIYRAEWGIGAAKPGASSHGGLWEGQETLAIDYGNWISVYRGDRARFYADQRAVGLSPGLISTARGYPDEPWHSIDKTPALGIILPATTGGAKPFPLPEGAPLMATAVIYYNDGKNNIGAIVDTRSGLFSAFSVFPVDYADKLAQGLGAGKAVAVTKGHYDKIRADLAKQIPAPVPAPVS